MRGKIKVLTKLITPASFFQFLMFKTCIGLKQRDLQVLYTKDENCLQEMSRCSIDTATMHVGVYK